MRQELFEVQGYFIEWKKLRLVKGVFYRMSDSWGGEWKQYYTAISYWY